MSDISRDGEILRANVSEFIVNPGIVGEMIENFDQYLPYVMEYNRDISNTSVFADAIRDFYFNGTLTESNFMQNVTEVRFAGLESNRPVCRTITHLTIDFFR